MDGSSLPTKRRGGAPLLTRIWKLGLFQLIAATSARNRRFSTPFQLWPPHVGQGRRRIGAGSTLSKKVGTALAGQEGAQTIGEFLRFFLRDEVPAFGDRAAFGAERHAA